MSMIIGQNGILTQTQNQVEQTLKSEAKEQAKIDILAWQSEKLGNGEDATLSNEIIKNILTGKDYVSGTPGDNSFITTKGKYEIKYWELYVNSNPKEGEEVAKPSTWPQNEKVVAISDGAGNIIPLPIDFYYVGGTKQEGVVISDEPNDDMENTIQGNQFVWVPVDNTTEEEFKRIFQRQEGYWNTTKDSYLTKCGEADSSGENQYLKENGISETQKTKEEAKLMYSSVKTYGGFYIGRYESGKDKNGKLVVKKGMDVYNNIPWSANGKMQETTLKTGGAVELSRDFASKYKNRSVTSTLCYGVQWDAALNFIDNNYITKSSIGNPACDINSYVRNSKDKGWYEQETTTKTGYYKINNIYDLAGNVSEWTMESYDTNIRIYRGGVYYQSGYEYSASCRFRFTDIGKRIS